MTFVLRTCIIGLATFAATGLITAILVPVLAARVTSLGAATRARHLAGVRLLPSLLALTSSLVVVLSFVFFEPRRPDEEIGLAFPALALLATALCLGAAWRAMRIALVTRRIIREWTATATPLAMEGISVPAFVIATSFPIVAVAGIRRSRLLIARSVLESCSAEELRAILAHEQGHIERRDNLRRLLLTLCPDVLSWLPASDRILRSWREASEEAADDDATRAGAEGRVRLAGALIKIAKLATPAQMPPIVPASALYCGEVLDRRVRRLLDPRIESDAPAARPWRGRLGIVLALAACVLTLEGVHAAVEYAIHTLP